MTATAENIAWRSALTTALIELTQPVDGGADLHDRTVELLGQRLDGAPEPVRLALATVLGRIGRPQDERLVAWLLKDPSPGVRRAAVQALARLGHFLVHNPTSRRHPLYITRLDHSRIADAVPMLHSPSQHIGHSFNTAMRMHRKPCLIILGIG